MVSVGVGLGVVVPGNRDKISIYNYKAIMHFVHEQVSIAQVP